MGHNATRLGAALAYYTVLSLAPLLILTVAVFGHFFGEAAVRGQVYWQIRQAVGAETASVVQSLLTGIHQPAGVNIVAGLVLLVGASGVFVELREDLNYIWNVPPEKGSGIFIFIRDRFFSFLMVLALGFLLGLSIAAGAFVHLVLKQTSMRVPAQLVESGNFIVAFLVKAFLFALVYRFIPEVRVDWEDVGIGALLTALFFQVGTFLTGIYLSRAGIGSAYGAAGSLVALLVWIYYSAQVFLYGAELTNVYAATRRPIPAPIPDPQLSSVPAAPGKTPRR